MQKITKKRLEVKREIAKIVQTLLEGKDMQLIAAGHELKVRVK